MNNNKTPNLNDVMTNLALIQMQAEVDQGLFIESATFG